MIIQKGPETFRSMFPPGIKVSKELTSHSDRDEVEVWLMKGRW